MKIKRYRISEDAANQMEQCKIGIGDLAFVMRFGSVLLFQDVKIFFSTNITSRKGLNASFQNIWE